jgi:hypothetical protein
VCIRSITCSTLVVCDQAERHKTYLEDELQLDELDDELDDDELIMKQTSERHQCYVRT